jgi:hypothetical protein
MGKQRSKTHALTTSDGEEQPPVRLSLGLLVGFRRLISSQRYATINVNNVTLASPAAVPMALIV